MNHIKIMPNTSVLEEDTGAEIGVVVFEHLEYSKRTRIWDIMVQNQYQSNCITFDD